MNPEISYVSVKGRSPIAVPDMSGTVFAEGARSPLLPGSGLLPDAMMSLLPAGGVDSQFRLGGLDAEVRAMADQIGSRANGSAPAGWSDLHSFIGRLNGSADRAFLERARGALGEVAAAIELAEEEPESLSLADEGIAELTRARAELGAWERRTAGVREEIDDLSTHPETADTRRDVHFVLQNMRGRVDLEDVYLDRVIRFLREYLIALRAEDEGGEKQDLREARETFVALVRFLKEALGYDEAAALKGRAKLSGVVARLPEVEPERNEAAEELAAAVPVKRKKSKPAAPAPHENEGVYRHFLYAYRSADKLSAGSSAEEDYGRFMARLERVRAAAEGNPLWNLTGIERAIRSAVDSNVAGAVAEVDTIHNFMDDPVYEIMAVAYKVGIPTALREAGRSNFEICDLIVKEKKGARRIVFVEVKNDSNYGLGHLLHQTFGFAKSDRMPVYQLLAQMSPASFRKLTPDGTADEVWDALVAGRVRLMIFRVRRHIAEHIFKFSDDGDARGARSMAVEMLIQRLSDYHRATGLAYKGGAISPEEIRAEAEQFKTLLAECPRARNLMLRIEAI